MSLNLVSTMKPPQGCCRCCGQDTTRFTRTDGDAHGFSSKNMSRVPRLPRIARHEDQVEMEQSFGRHKHSTVRIHNCSTTEYTATLLQYKASRMQNQTGHSGPSCQVEIKRGSPSGQGVDVCVPVKIETSSTAGKHPLWPDVFRGDFLASVLRTFGVPTWITLFSQVAVAVA